MNQAIPESYPYGTAVKDCESLPWSQLSPGVDLKLLYSSEKTGRWTALLKFQPGCVLPRHKHLSDAEFYVLKGRADHPQVGTFKAGDYVFERDGAVHDELTVDEEVVLLMISHGSAAFLNPDDSVQFSVDASSLQAMTATG